MTLSNFITIISTGIITSLSAGILFICKYLSATTVDQKLLMKKYEQGIGSIINTALFYFLFVLCGAILYLSRSSFVDFVSDEIGKGLGRASLVLLIAFMLTFSFVVFAQFFKKYNFLRKHTRTFTIALVLVYGIDLVNFAIILDDLRQYMIADLYLSLALLICTCIFSSNQAKEYCLYYLKAENGNGKTPQKPVYIYRKINDKFVLCGYTMKEDEENSGCWLTSIEKLEGLTLKRAKIEPNENKENLTTPEGDEREEKSKEIEPDEKKTEIMRKN